MSQTISTLRPPGEKHTEALAFDIPPHTRPSSALTPHTSRRKKGAGEEGGGRREEGGGRREEGGGRKEEGGRRGEGRGRREEGGSW